MTENATAVLTPQEVMALTIPDGTFELTQEMHLGLLTHVHAPELFSTAPGAAAHPIFAHLATHCGMGWTFNEFLAAVGAAPEDGVVFGGGTFTYHRSPVIGARYLVRSRMQTVERKSGRRVGTFDAITIELQLVDIARDDVTLVTTETYIVPRRTLPTSAAPPALPRLAAPSSAATGVPGPVYPVGPVTRADIVGIMKVMNDTNPVHLDADLALASGYRGPVNQGPANLAYMFNAIASDRGRIDDLGFVEFRFRNTVTEGDRLEVSLSKSAIAAVGAEWVAAELAIVGIGPAVSCRAEFGLR